MNLKIRVQLPADRTKTGTLVLVDPVTGGVLFGPVPVLGHAAKGKAEQNGNPGRDPLRPYGHTPLGGYRVTAIRPSGNAHYDAARYGGSGVVALDPVDGDARTAEQNGRTGLLIHAGRHPNAPFLQPSALKSTNGCIRILEHDLVRLLGAIGANSLLFPGELAVEVGPAGPPGTVDDTVDDPDPPPSGAGIG